jgi:hypothetical protein
LPADANVLAYERRWEEQRFIILLELESRPGTVELGRGVGGRVELSTHGDRTEEPVSARIALRPDEGLVIKVIP